MLTVLSRPASLFSDFFCTEKREFVKDLKTRTRQKVVKIKKTMEIYNLSLLAKADTGTSM